MLELRELIAALHDTGPDTVRAGLQQRTQRPMRLRDRALIDAVDKTITHHAAELGQQPDMLRALVRPFLICALIEDEDIAAFYGDLSLPELRLRFPVVLPREDREQLHPIDSPVLGLACSPDGRRVAVSTKRSGLRIFDLASGEVTARLTQKDPPVLSMAWLDSDHLITGAKDGSVGLWNVSTGACTPQTGAHSQPVRCCATSGSIFVTGSDDGTTRVWDPSGGAPLILSGQGGHIVSCDVSVNRVATGSTSGTAVIWDLTDHDSTVSFPAHRGAVNGCAFVPEADILITAGQDGALRGWNTGSGDELFAIDHSQSAIQSLSMAPGGERVVTGGANHTPTLWDIVHPRRLGVFFGHRRRVTAVGWGANGHTVWSGSMDRTIRSWGLSDLRTPGVALHHTGSVRACAFSPDQRTVVSGSRDGTIQLWDLNSGAAIRTFDKQKGAIYDLAFSPTGDRLVSVGTNGEVIVWDTETGRRRSGGCREKLPVTCCAFIDATQLVTGGRDNRLTIWDLDRGAAIDVLEGHSHWVRCCVVHPDGGHAVSGSYDGTLRIWDLSTGAAVRTLTHHNKPVVDCAITVSGSRVVSVCLDGDLVVWRFDTGQIEHVIKAHGAPAAGVAVFGDEFAVSVGQDHWLRGWCLSTGKPRLARILTGPLDSIALTDRMLAVGDRSGNLWVFDDDSSRDDGPTDP